MFKIGDFIEVTDNGNVAIILEIDQNKVWVEWQFRIGDRCDYKKHEAFPLWQKTNKRFNSVCSTGNQINITNNSARYSDSLLDKFEQMLAETEDCNHHYLSYWGISKKAYDYCKHCEKQMPYNHLKIIKKQ